MKKWVLHVIKGNHMGDMNMVKFKRLVRDIEIRLRGVDIMHHLGRSRHREPKVGFPVLIGLMLWFHVLNLRNYRQYHRLFSWMFRLSYSRFMYWKALLNRVVKELLDKSLVSGLGKTLCIDSTHMDICKFYYRDQFKTLRRESTIGYSTTGQFFGFKLHVVIDLSGNLVKYHITDGKAHDLTVFKEAFLPTMGFFCILLADRGYRNRLLHEELRTMGINVDMKNRLRWKVESVFNTLKNSFCLVYNKSRSFDSYRSHVYSSLLAYQLSINP